MTNGKFNDDSPFPPGHPLRDFYHAERPEKLRSKRLAGRGTKEPSLYVSSDEVAERAEQVRARKGTFRSRLGKLFAAVFIALCAYIFLTSPGEVVIDEQGNVDGGRNRLRRDWEGARFGRIKCD